MNNYKGDALNYLILDLLRKGKAINTGSLTESQLQYLYKQCSQLGILPYVSPVIDVEPFRSHYAVNSLKVKKNLKYIKRLYNKLHIDFAVFKGIPLAFTAYKNIYSRIAGDIDIIIKKQNFESVREFLLRDGFFQVGRSHLRQDERNLHVQAFYREKDDILVGVHWMLSNPLIVRLDYNDLDFTHLEIEKVKLKTLTAEWQFVNLCIHLFQHAFPLRIFLDIYKLATEVNLDCRNIMQIVTKHKLEYMVHLAVVSASSVFETKDLIPFEFCTSTLSKRKAEAFSKFLSSPIWLFRLRRLVCSIPYLDELFVHLVLGKLPPLSMNNVFSLPIDFIKRIEGKYAVSR